MRHESGTPCFAVLYLSGAGPAPKRDLWSVLEHERAVARADQRQRVVRLALDARQAERVGAQDRPFKPAGICAKPLMSVASRLAGTTCNNAGWARRHWAKLAVTRRLSKSRVQPIGVVRSRAAIAKLRHEP